MCLTVHRKIGVSFDHMRSRVRYILKGADADTRRFLGCTKSEWGYVQGKRAGASQALNRKARRQAGGVLPSGLRRPTKEMLEAARERDRLKDEARVAGSFTSPYSSTVSRRQAQAVKDYRRQYGMTQERMAQAIGVSRPQLANVEQGRFGLGEEAGQKLTALVKGRK